MKKIIMIADDLTGACDAGVQFTQKGFKTVISFDEKTADQQENVVVFDTNSRSASAASAYKKVDQMVSGLKKEEISFVYKKVDSTLRGNLGSEIDALMDRFSFEYAVVAPALPALGRTTVNGMQYVYNVPVDQTEIGNDPKTPVKEPDIVRLLSNQSTREACLFPASFLTEDPSVLTEKVTELLDKKKTLFVCDAKEEADLKKIASAFSQLPHNILWVGSAGLAEWLVDSSGSHSRPAIFVNKAFPVLVVSGSRSAVAKRQLHTFLSLSKAKQVDLAPGLLLTKESRDTEVLRCQQELESYLQKGYDVVFSVKHENTAYPNEQMELPALIEESLSKAASEAVKKHTLGGIVLTGGDTAKAISNKLGVTGIELLGEVEQGLPVSRMIGGPELITVTKAGAFGTDLSLYEVVTQLKGDA